MDNPNTNTQMISYSLKGVFIERASPQPSKELVESILSKGEPLVSHEFVIRGIPLKLADVVQSVNRRYHEDSWCVDLRILVMPDTGNFCKTVKDLTVSELDIVHIVDNSVEVSKESLKVRLKSVQLLLDGESHDLAFYAVRYEIL